MHSLDHALCCTSFQLNSNPSPVPGYLGMGMVASDVAGAATRIQTMIASSDLLLSSIWLWDCLNSRMHGHYAPCMFIWSIGEF